ncbi:hypothetical protein K503DRAFT_699296, partial [Rhizopogon vinicolor AM-OR11-026]
EDVVNKPWRPVPSMRISVEDCHALRCGLMVFCLVISFLFGVNVHVSSTLLTVVDFVRDDFGLSHHYVSKNFCTVGGYATLELGATLVLCRKFYISE